MLHILGMLIFWAAVFIFMLRFLLPKFRHTKIVQCLGKYPKFFAVLTLATGVLLFLGSTSIVTNHLTFQTPENVARYQGRRVDYVLHGNETALIIFRSGGGYSQSAALRVEGGYRVARPVRRVADRFDQIGGHFSILHVPNTNDYYAFGVFRSTRGEPTIRNSNGAEIEEMFLHVVNHTGTDEYVVGFWMFAEDFTDDFHLLIDGERVFFVED